MAEQKSGKEFSNDSLTRLNISIDAKSLMEKLSYRPEAIEIVEDKLRALCPIHQDKNFRTFTVDLKNNHFKCHYTQCDGYKGGNLLYLYSIVQKVSLGEAAMYWSKTLNIPLEEGKKEGAALAEEEETSAAAPAAEKTVKENHFNKGVSFYTRNLLDEAVKEFEIAKTDDPDKELQIHNMLGLCFMKQGSYDKAIDEFKKGLQCKGYEEKEYNGLQYNLGRVYEASGKMKEALEIFQVLFKKDPKYQDVEQRVKKLEAAEGAPAPRKIKISYV